MSDDEKSEVGETSPTRTYLYEEGELGRWAEGLVQRLIELRDKTNPDKGPSSAVGKDFSAFEALQAAGDLVKALAGWAIDHRLGLASAGLQFVPKADQTVRSFPEFAEARDQVDDHRHETEGVKINDEGDWASFGVQAKRRFIAGMLLPNTGGYPDEVAHELEHAIQALSYGETSPILAANREHSKVNLTEYAEHLNAVCFAAFRSNSGLMKVGDARKDVSSAYNVTPETIRTWEKRLRDEFGGLHVTRRLGFARNAASWIAEKAKTNRSQAFSMMIQHDEYGDEAMKKSAIRYWASRTASD